MQKTILITGATDGIGFYTAKALVAAGHNVLVHGRNAVTLAKTANQLSASANDAKVQTLLADLSSIKQVQSLADEITTTVTSLDVLINNAGVFKATETVTADGLDIRFAVNTIAPYLLTKKLLPLLGAGSRVVNVSSAAQAPVNMAALEGTVKLDDMSAYSQSKLAITTWTRSMALSHERSGPLFVSVNPGSLLASKMVKEGFNTEGRDIGIGADILTRAATSNEFDNANGNYFDNDAGQFGPPHPDALDAAKSAELVKHIEAILSKHS